MKTTRTTPLATRALIAAAVLVGLTACQPASTLGSGGGDSSSAGSVTTTAPTAESTVTTGPATPTTQALGAGDHISELDLNPFIVCAEPGRSAAVDAVLVLDSGHSGEG